MNPIPSFVRQGNRLSDVCHQPQNKNHYRHSHQLCQNQNHMEHVFPHLCCFLQAEGGELPAGSGGLPDVASMKEKI